MALDPVITAVNAANTRLNGKVETLQAIGGQVIGNTQAFSQQVVNDAWRKLQNRLADMRYSGLQQEQIFLDVPASANPDPVSQVRFDFNGYFDGVTNWPAFALPSALIRPYELTERPTGTQNIFTEMDPVPWALPRVVKAAWNREWLWRNNALYMPGASSATDITMLYAALLADFLDGVNPWFQQTIPLLNSVDAFADYICREIAVARGDFDGAMAFQASAERNAMLIADQDSTQGKSVMKNSEYQKMRDQFTPNTASSATQEVKR